MYTTHSPLQDDVLTNHTSLSMIGSFSIRHREMGVAYVVTYNTVHKTNITMTSALSHLMNHYIEVYRM